jgi:hypothetical protein
MNIIHVFVVVGACLFIAFLVYKYVFKRRGEASGLSPLPVECLGVIWYDKKMMSGAEIAAFSTRLLDVKNLVWSKYQHIYGRDTEYHLDSIILDVGLPKTAKMLTGSGRVFLNPDMNYLRGFVAELHNLYRCDTFGTMHIYCSEALDAQDQMLCERAQRIQRNYLPGVNSGT